LVWGVLPVVGGADDFKYTSSLIDRSPPYQGLSLTCAKPDDAADKFTIAILPDTQYYSKYDPQTYELQAREIAADRTRRNVKLVVHVGDIVNNWDDIGQWKAARKAHKIFDDAGVPYVVTTGNHDVEDWRGVKVHDATNFARYFGYGNALYPNNWLNQPWLNTFGSQVRTTISSSKKATYGSES